MGDVVFWFPAWVWLLLLVVLAVIPATIAGNKGRSQLGWWAAGVLLFLPALIASLAVQDLSTDQELRKGTATRCRHCREVVPLAATTCPRCRQDPRPEMVQLAGTRIDRDAVTIAEAIDGGIRGHDLIAHLQMEPGRIGTLMETLRHNGLIALDDQGRNVLTDHGTAALAHWHAGTAPSGEADPASPAGDGTLTGQLRELAQLHADGHLDDDEFAAAKRQLLH